jgi:acetoin:2,6-dichlorophenolindophenol oxidoreductase subunit alpha
MPAPLPTLYRRMVFLRGIEQELEALWAAGRISGEFHSGIGEEGIVAGVMAHTRPGDAIAVDHRSTPPFLAHGVDPVAIVRELLGRPDGLDAGQAGHMHLMDPTRLAAASGIVGAAGPTACGFGLAAQQAGDGGVAVAFFGEGATNQGMLLESFNLAVAWRLPVVFVCKDDGWSITTRSGRLTGGRLTARARGFGMPAKSVDGRRVDRVFAAADRAVARARAGRGPTFLHLRCHHPSGHFLGFQLRTAVQAPVAEVPPLLGPMLRAGLQRDVPVTSRVAGLARASQTMAAAAATWRLPHRDPVAITRRQLPAVVTAAIESEVDARIAAVFHEALQPLEVAA